MIFILGPCVIESFDHALGLAGRINRICWTLGIGRDPDDGPHWVFKASFDKANRMSIDSYRGPGFKAGMEILAAIKAETNVRVISDIHEPGQAEPAADVLDIIQIPAMLCRQTDLVVAAARTGRPINVKKSQSMAPEDMAFVVEKIRRFSSAPIYLTERGTAFGYHDLVVDVRSIPTMKATGCPVIIDAGHSVQKPGAAGGRSGGRPEYIETIALAGVAAGADGIFCEVHDDPANAKSDGPNSLPLERIEPLILNAVRVKTAICER